VSAAIPKTSATLIRDQLRLMKELYGEAPVAEACAALPPEAQAEIETMVVGGWISTDSAQALKAAVAERVGEPLMHLQRRVVRVAIERTLHTVWRFFMRQLSDAELARRATIIYTRSFDHGSLELKHFGVGEAIYEVHGWPTIPEFDLVGLLTGAEAMFALAGRKDAHVTATRRPPVVELRMVWKKGA
jgi:hypothetical protein